ncbi:T9SS type A sorting domain-containing protein, partial [Ekhidna sp.]|uniref:T9SS type A sorting domain-containing protein n=1 Tax=Ekhidna sp. TaxID=2608089 RepID=UPI0032EE117B
LTNIDIVFSEDISSINAFGDFTSGDFTATGAAIDGVDASIVNLTVNTLSGTDFTSTDLDIAAGAVSDGANSNAETLDQTVSDGIAPAFVSATFYDTNSDGSIDEILLTFTEGMDESSPEDVDFLIDGSAASFTILAGGTGLNGVDISTTDEYITLDVELGVTADLSIEYVQDDANAELSDISGNEAADDIAITEIDAAPPVLIDAQIEDTNDDGLIDRVVYVFSEPVDDADDNSTYVVGDVGTITLPDGETAAGYGPGNIGVSDDGTFGYVTITGITGQLTENTAIGSFDVSGVNGLWDDEHDLTSIGDGAEGYIDAAAPIILSASNVLQASNAYLEVTFSEGVYNSLAGAVSVGGAEFNLDFQQNTGTATAGGIDNLTQNDVDETATAAGDDVIRFQLAITGSTDGSETIEITPTDGSSVFDASNNPMLATQTTTVVMLYAVDKVTFVDAYMDATNAFLIIEFSDPMSRDGSNASNKEAQWKSDRGLFYQSYNDGGSGVLFDFPPSTDMLEADGTDISGADNGAQIQLRVNTNSVTGTPTGLESFQVYNPSVSKLKSFPDSKTLDPGSTITVFLSDEFGDLFDNASATAYDNSGDGTIDQVEVVMTDDIIDATIDFNDFTFGGVSPSGFDTGSTPDDDTFTLLFSTYPDGTGVISTLDYTSDGLSTRLTDDAGNNIVDGSVSPSDAALPQVASASINSSNAYLEVVFTETIYPVDGTINLADFDITISNSTATVTVADVLDAQGNSSLSSEDTLRFTLNVAPNALAPDGTETVEISTDGTTFDDVATNGLPGSETTGPINLNIVTDQITITDITYSVKAADQGYIEYTFSEGLLSGDAGTARIANSTSGIIETGNWTNGSADAPLTDDVNFQYAQNGSPVTIDDADVTDIEWTDNSDNIIVYNSGTGGYTGTIFRLHLNDINGGPFRGVETYTINAVDGRVSGRSTGGPWIETNSYVFTLPDLYGDDFDDALSAEAHDVNADGNIDEVVVIFSDDIDDASLAASLGDFTFNGVSPNSVVATPLNGVDPNTPGDHIFTLGFNSYVGSAVIGDLDFTQGTLTDDAGNLILTGSVTPSDEAGPVVLSARTNDADLNGNVDEIIITFSEAFTEVGTVTVGDFTAVNDVDFSHGSYTVSGVVVSSPTITLDVSKDGAGTDTNSRPDFTVAAGIIQDGDLASNPIQTFTNTADGAKAYARVDNLTTTNNQPSLTGTITEDAIINVIVDGSQYAVNPGDINVGAGTWVLDNTGGSLFTLGALGNYEITLVTIDNAGNVGTDITGPELTLNGGVVPSHNGDLVGNTVTTLCGNNQFSSLGDIELAETNSTDFSIQSNANLLLELPSGMRFNQSVSLTILDNGQDINAGTDISYSFISSRILELEFNVTGNSGTDVITIQGIEVASTITGTGIQLTRGGGNVQMLGSNAIGTPFAEMDISAATVSGTDVSISYTTPVVRNENNVLETSMLTGATFTATPNGVTGIDTLWIDDDGSTVLMNSSSGSGSVTETDILSAGNGTPGLFTRYVAYDDSPTTCISEFLTINFLVYTFDDGGLNTEFDGAVYDLSASDDPFNITFSRPSGHTATATGTPVSAVTTGASTTIITIDPNQGDGAYPVDYTITNPLGESVTLTATFNITTTSPLYETGTFQLNGSVTATDNEYCTNDVLDFEVNNAHVATLEGADAFFYAIGWVPVSYSLTPSNVRVTEMVAPGGAVLANGATMTSSNPMAGWGIDLDAIYQLAVNPANATEENYGREALLSGVRLVSVFMKHGGTFSTTVDPALNGTLGLVHPFEMLEIPTLNIADVNAVNYCVDDNADVTLQAIVDGSTIDMDNGYQLLLASNNSVQATETDALFNPADYAPNDYKIVYETDPNAAGCTNIDTMQITVNAVPVDPQLTTTPIYLTDYLPDFYTDNVNQYLGLDTWVFEIPNIDSLVSGTNFKEYVLMDNTAGSTYNWYNDNAGTPGDLLVSNNWVFYYNSWFDDPSTTSVVEQPAPGEYTFYVAKTTNGCESAYRRFKIFIYNKPTRPLPLASYQTNLNTNVDEANLYQQGTGHYIAEFCDNYGGNEIVFNGPDESASNPTSPFASDGAYLNIYSSIPGGSEADTIRAVIDDAGGNAVLTAADFGYSGTGAFDTTIYVTQVWNDRTPGFGNTGANGVNDFEGTESLPTRIDISIFTQPTAPTLATDFPTLSSLNLHICEGETFASFLNSAAGIDTYVWYDAAGTTEIMRVNSGSQMTSANLLANASAAQYDNTVPNIYTFQVSRIANSNDVRSFEGCESDQTTFTIEVHPIDDVDFPVVASADYSDEGDLSYDRNSTADHIFPVCLTELNPSAVLDVSSAYPGVKEFVWYESDGSFTFSAGNEINSIADPSAPTFDELGMGLADISSATTKQFIVTQRLDTDDFAGCESVLARTYIEVQFSDLGALTVSMPTSTNGSSTNEYCYDDSRGDFQMILNEAGTPVGSSNVTYYEVRLAGTPVVIDLDPGAPVVPATGSGYPTVDLDAWFVGGGGDADYLGGPEAVLDVYFEYTHPSLSCIGTYIETLTIYPDPDISFTLNGVDLDNLEFCYDETGIELQGTLSDGTPLLSGSFTIDAVGVSTNQGKATIDADEYHGTNPGDEYNPQQSYLIEYTYSSAAGCQYSVTKNMIINPLPEVVSETINSVTACADETVILEVPLAGGLSASDYIFDWYVAGNYEATIVGDNQLSTNSITGTANVRVDITHNTRGCLKSISSSITVGVAPVPAISWVGTTANCPTGTDFRITEDNATLPDGDVNYVEFFVNGVSQFIDTSPSFPLNYNYNTSSPGYIFTSAGNYPLRVIMRTTAGCEVDLTTRNIDIIDHLPSLTSYTEDFESGDGGWSIETLSIDGKSNTLATSWEIGTNVPDSTGGATFDGSNAVYTNGYQSSEVSFVYSPSFDLSAFSAPTISFLRYEDFETFRDGVVFQMSVDDGRTWVNVGGFDDAQPEGLKSTPNWYNREAITSAPGTVSPGPQSVANNAQGIGWAENSDWKEAIAPLAIPAGQEQYVRFRFALAAQATPKTTNGFAFDLVQIYDREQIVLVEQFSSTLSQDSYDINGLIDAAPIFNGNDILRINYFTDFANSGDFKDALNQRNTSAPGARSSYYGIEDIPSISISGDAQLISNASQLSGSIAAQLTNAKLVNPGFDISINASIDAENVLTVGANFTAISELPRTDTKLGLFLAILEPEIVVDNTMGSIGLYQVGDAITNVLRKMLPSAAGQFEQGAVAINDVLTIEDMTWPVSNMYVMDTLTVVAYVQDLSSKQVLQSEVLGLSNPNTELALGLNELTDFSLYPNPADKEVTVEFADVLREKTEWVIFDQAGREVLKGELDKGTKTMTVQTSEMPSGLYFIHLYAEDRKRQSKRIMVLH